MQQFLEAIYGSAQGYVSIVIRDQNDWEKANSQHWQRWPDKKLYLEKYCKLLENEDVYCSVALFSGEERSNSDPYAMANVVWADADTCSPDKFRVTPSISVETSPGRWHVWWVLEEPVKASEASKMAQRIAYAHKDEGCDLGWSVSKILRVPGTTNAKDPDNPFTVQASYTGEVFTLEQLSEVYGDQEVVNPLNELSNDAPEFLSYTEQAALEARVIKNSSMENLYLDKPEEGSDWSNKLFRLQFDLFREGCTPQEVYTLSKHAACNKFERDNRPDSDLWDTVRKAYTKFTADVESPIPLAPSIQIEVPAFLTEIERAALPETFVDRYVSWVAERTDAAPTYSRTLAFMILSSIFGGRGYLPDSYGDKFLNLWAILSGPTTQTRKTTARDIALRIVHGFEINALGGERIDIGSDVTKEGLGKVLGERDGLVSLVQTDEVSGMFKEMYGKSYQHGTIEYFTKLYDGTVPVVIRAAKDAGQNKRAKTIFNFLGLGVPSEISEILTRRDFDSGFLTRMLWCVADAPSRKPGSDDWPDDTYEYHLTENVKWIYDLKKRALKFDTEKPAPIRISKQAKARYNQWAEMVRQHAESYHDSVLEASVTRFEHSVRKAAALLAMYDGTTTIELHHLLPALAQGELWYGDLLRMLNDVSASVFEKLQNQVESFIAQGKNATRPDYSVRRKFADLRPQELNEVLLTLTQQGRIRGRTNTEWQVLTV